MWRRMRRVLRMQALTHAKHEPQVCYHGLERAWDQGLCTGLPIHVHGMMLRHPWWCCLQRVDSVGRWTLKCAICTAIGLARRLMPLFTVMTFNVLCHHSAHMPGNLTTCSVNCGTGQFVCVEVGAVYAVATFEVHMLLRGLCSSGTSEINIVHCIR